jgi:hypothetical protein
MPLKLEALWQCCKEAFWGFLPSPVCIFAQSISIYSCMATPTELQKAWRQAPCAKFVVPIAAKRLAWDPWHMRPWCCIRPLPSNINLTAPPTMIIDHFCSCIQLSSTLHTHLSLSTTYIFSIELVCAQFQQAEKCKIVEPYTLQVGH